MPILGRIYASIFRCFRWWPLDFFPLGTRKKSPVGIRVAYYLWRFPTLSETFIQREVKALRASGLRLEVVADAAADLALLDDVGHSLRQDTIYLNSLKGSAFSKYRRYFFLKNPLLFCSLFVYIAAHRYGPRKSFKQDIQIFSKATLLAGVLKDKNTEHLHSPWADISAFIVSLAATLLRVPYSVEARAHDVHRDSYRFGFREKFENAAFVVTNSRYNEDYLRSLTRKSRIAIVYNGVDLKRFNPLRDEHGPRQPVKVLCVARLIEQKGLVYLLKACRILKDQRCAFTCHIVGGPEEPLYTRYWSELKELHGNLALEDSVLFLGARSFDDVLEQYKTADIFVLPCVVAEDGSRDITPNALIEAMAMRLPVVSTTVTAIPEIVDDGVCGLLVPPRDAQAVAAAVIRLSEEPLLRRHFGDNGRRKVEAQFDIAANVKKLVQLFQQGGE